MQSNVTGKNVTRRRILDAATAVFSEKGYHGTAVDDIVKVSNTSKGSFYFHFPSKQEIFFALVDRLIASLARSAEDAIKVEHGPLDKVNAALETVFHNFSRHRNLAKILLVSGVGLGKAFDERLLAIHATFASLIKKHLDEAEKILIELIDAYPDENSLIVLLAYLYQTNKDQLSFYIYNQ